MSSMPVYSLTAKTALSLNAPGAVITPGTFTTQNRLLRINVVDHARSVIELLEVKMFFALLMLVFGTWIGWEWAHSTIATECERQGSFYVGKKTFKCSEITEHE